MKPIIGITALDDKEHSDYNGSGVPHPPRYGQNQSYCRAVEAAGGVPIIIPIIHDGQALRRVYSLLDGLLLPGGWDIDPQHYGEEAHPTTEVMADLDQMEFKLVDWALGERMPILAICRGMQVLNVALGGDLYQDIDSQIANALNHNQREQHLPAKQFGHEIVVQEGSYLASIAGRARLGVNTFHHQAVRRLATPLRVSAFADDGIIEAADWVADERFIHAVQCHPEYLWDEHDWAGRLFHDFVTASADFRTRPKD